MLEVLFWILAAAALLGAVLAISLKNPLFCALSLVGSFAALAGLFFQLKAAFPAILQIMLYAGAIMVLVIFVIMFLNLPEDRFTGEEISKPGIILALFLLVPLAALLLVAIWTTELPAFGPVKEDFGSIHAVGIELFTNWLYPFELLSLLIVAAMVGAVMLAKKKAADHD